MTYKNSSVTPFPACGARWAKRTAPPGITSRICMPTSRLWGNLSMRSDPSRRGLKLFCALGLAGLVLASRPAMAVVEIADTGQFVIDTAHVLDPATRDRLEKLL